MLKAIYRIALADNKGFIEPGAEVPDGTLPDATVAILLKNGDLKREDGGNPPAAWTPPLPATEHENPVSEPIPAG